MGKTSSGFALKLYTRLQKVHIERLKLGELSILMRFDAECCEIEEEEEENGDDKEAVVVFESKMLAEDSKLKVMKFGEIKRRNLVDLTTRYERIGFPKFIRFNKYLSGISSVAIGWHKNGILSGLTKHPISVRNLSKGDVCAQYWEPLFRNLWKGLTRMKEIPYIVCTTVSKG